MIANQHGQFSIAPPKVSVRSMVGAGESYVAVLTMTLSRGWSLLAANRYDIAAAASAVTREATELCHGVRAEELFKLAGKPVYGEAVATPSA